VDTLAKWIAVAGGAGYVPVAPGTAGTAVAIPLAYAMSGQPLWAYLAITAAITVIAIWAADRADRVWGTHDCQKIVIDEVAGYLVTMTLVDRAHWIPLVVGFVVFRVFDQIKPPPVRWIDEHLPGGAGVVLDDVGAGVQGLVTMVALDHFGALAWLADHL
jgi:phosphatidylglycerophosphatase A